MVIQPIITSLILVLAITGNTLQFIVFSRKKFAKFSSRNFYCVLATQDTFYIIYSLTINELLSYFGIDYQDISIALCRFTSFIIFAFSPISGWIIAFISIDKFISICYPSKEIIRSGKFQALILSLIYFYNIVYYIPVPIFAESINQNKSSNLSSENGCKRTSFFYTMDLFNLALIPFALMLTFSILLIIKIFKTRLRLLSFTLPNDRKRLMKDVKFSLSSIVLNLSYILLTLPICVADLNEFSDEINEIIYHLYYLNYLANFYILMATNSIFRKEFFAITRLKPR